MRRLTGNLSVIGALIVVALGPARAADNTLSDQQKADGWQCLFNGKTLDGWSVKSGFATYKVSDVPVLVGQITTIDATLKPGSLHEEVTVAANALAVEQVSSSLGYVAGATQIIELPLSRSPYSPTHVS